MYKQYHFMMRNFKNKNPKNNKYMRTLKWRMLTKYIPVLKVLKPKHEKLFLDSRQWNFIFINLWILWWNMSLEIHTYMQYMEHNDFFFQLVGNSYNGDTNNKARKRRATFRDRWLGAGWLFSCKITLTFIRNSRTMKKKHITFYMDRIASLFEYICKSIMSKMHCEWYYIYHQWSSR